MSDLIKRSDAIKAASNALWEYLMAMDDSYINGIEQAVEGKIKSVPSADEPQKTLAEALAPYTNREELMMADAEARGYAEGFKEGLEADRPQGEWIEVEEDWRHQIEFWKCSECDFAVSSMYNYCPDCGARMKGADDE